ncbi:hypothetical protein UFOVP695_9 [uncultured Caudovirales phage]|uniref:Uncharacterized protein n=1 Tax=uncultured Caudovirales phage TaxID=2100421 RepID=A0A6J5NEG7_9CAUD|nr:hypothetical protein UFOVP695_9 [uncultured Caudovirales phage]
MNKSVEILIELNETKYYLDYDKLDGISLNYNINRIQELENLDSSYSQSIKLVNSKNNQNVLGYISNLNIENGTFDPNLKTRAKILVDSVVIFDGFLQLLSIEYGDNEVSYSAVIYADNANLYSSIENKFLSDLDFSRFTYTYDFDTFLKTATSSCDKDAIIFPLIDYGSNWKYNQISGTGSSLGSSASTIDMNELYPAVYTKTIFDQIFIDAGYKYESDFLNGTASDFRKLVIPFSNESLLSSEEVNEEEFLGVKSQSNYLIGSQIYGSVIQYQTPYDTIQFASDASDRFNFSSQEYQNGDVSLFQRFGVDVDLTLMLGVYRYSKIPIIIGRPETQTSAQHIVQAQNVSVVFLRQYNENTNSLDANPINEFYRIPLYSSNNGSSPLTNLVGQNNGLGNNITDINTNFILRAYTQGSQYYPVGTKYILNNENINLERNPYVTYYGATPSGNSPQWVNYLDMGRITSNDTLFTPWMDGSKKALIPLKPNERVKVVFELSTIPGGNRTIFDFNPSGMYLGVGTYPLKSPLFLSTTNIYDGRTIMSSAGWTHNSGLTYSNSLVSENTNEVGIGTSLPISPNLPNNIRQIDFLKSVIKMFNLYVEPIQGKLNSFKIEPRDDYYSNSKIKDWSDKVDLTQSFSSDVLSNTQAKETIFKYSDDDDFYNKLYKKSFNESYGQYKYITSNEFVTGTNNIELIFASTPLRYVYESDIVISSIQKDLNYNQIGKPGNVIRILYCDILPIPGGKTITIEKSLFSNYIYAGHFDNPYDPLIDLSFELPKKIYYTFVKDGNAKLTYNGLYNLYYRNQFSEINNDDSRLLKVNIRLNELDIYDFKFSDTIYLYINENVNGYFRVNSINEYDPIGDRSVSVEMIKIDYTPGSFVISKTPTLNTENIKANTLNLGSLNTYDSSAIIVGRRNDIKGIGNNVNGDSNIVTGNGLNVNGDNNNVVGDYISVRGVNNEIYGSKIDITGSSNIISLTSSSTNGRITGDENTLNQSVESLNIVGNSNVIGIEGSTSSITNIIAFGNNNNLSINIKQGFIVGSGNYASASGLDNVYFFGNNTELNENFQNKFVVGDELTLNAERLAIGGVNNDITKNSGIILGYDNNHIGPFGENNVNVGNGTTIQNYSTSNILIGDNNTIGAYNPTNSNGISLKNCLLMVNDALVNTDTFGVPTGVIASYSNSFIFSNNQDPNYILVERDNSFIYLIDSYPDTFIDNNTNVRFEVSPPKKYETFTQSYIYGPSMDMTISNIIKSSDSPAAYKTSIARMGILMADGLLDTKRNILYKPYLYRVLGENRTQLIPGPLSFRQNQYEIATETRYVLDGTQEVSSLSSRDISNFVPYNSVSMVVYVTTTMYQTGTTFSGPFSYPYTDKICYNKDRIILTNPLPGISSSPWDIIDIKNMDYFSNFGYTPSVGYTLSFTTSFGSTLDGELKVNVTYSDLSKYGVFLTNYVIESNTF